jgi:patatin-like phospholipase/acyl hydrolase
MLEIYGTKEQYQKRNNFIHLFASNANRFEIDEADFDYCTTNFDLDTREIKNAVNSAYKNQIADFVKPKFANL